MIKEILEQISVWIILLPFVVGLICIKKMQISSTIIFILVCVACIPQLLPNTFINSKYFNITYNIYTIAEFGLVLLFFYKNYFFKHIKTIAFASAIVYFFIALYYFFTFSITNEFINQLPCINNLFYVFWIILFVIETEVEQATKQYSFNTHIYFIIGILQYAATSTFIIGIYHLKHYNSLLNTLWIFQSLPNITMYILFTIGFLFDAKKYNQLKLINKH